ncbi:Homeobox protein onecut [Folsomia candida]|uniref:Homeobox protein onecut n=1 Tax=Folsomia candida TaxID=158441 RepID=A0A226D137_FOLCA|nr:Homeobox protein onecut [Folsomia candida]
MMLEMYHPAGHIPSWRGHHPCDIVDMPPPPPPPTRSFDRSFFLQSETTIKEKPHKYPSRLSLSLCAVINVSPSPGGGTGLDEGRGKLRGRRRRSSRHLGKVGRRSLVENGKAITFPFVTCKRKEDQTSTSEHPPTTPKKPRLVFTDLQRRTLQAIFKETKRPSKEMQVTIARQLGLEPTTVGNFFMNARRRSMDKWKEENEPSPKSNSSNAGSTTPNGIHAGGESDDHDHDVL